MYRHARNRYTKDLLDTLEWVASASLLGVGLVAFLSYWSGTVWIS